jgi:hypothetical protein
MMKTIPFLALLFFACNGNPVNSNIQENTERPQGRGVWIIEFRIMDVLQSLQAGFDIPDAAYERLKTVTQDTSFVKRISVIERTTISFDVSILEMGSDDKTFTASIIAFKTDGIEPIGDGIVLATGSSNSAVSLLYTF